MKFVRYPLITIVVLLNPLMAGDLLAEVMSGGVREAVQSCRALSVESERLACYDNVSLETDLPVAEVAHSESEAMTSTIAVVPVIASDATAESTKDLPADSSTDAYPSPEENFGLEFSVKDAPQKLTSEIVAVRKNAKGGVILSLANDQVWQQSGMERLFLDEGQSVTIHRGAFSAFYLAVNDKGRRYRFARVK